jgi:CsoR family transcriptional regulator, copper-sensing transcriptional repressor
VAKHGSLHHDPELNRKLHTKAKIAAGHLTGIARMIDEDKYCIDILKQIAAVQGTLTAISRELAHSHIIHCVQSSVNEGSGVAAVEELLQTLKYLQRS